VNAAHGFFFSFKVYLVDINLYETIDSSHEERLHKKMKFITAAPILFTSTVFAAWTTTPALSAKVEALTTINDKVRPIH
jgi:hypothetical protein